MVHGLATLLVDAQARYEELMGAEAPTALARCIVRLLARGTGRRTSATD